MMANAQTILAVIRIMMIDIKHNSVNGYDKNIHDANDDGTASDKDNNDNDAKLMATWDDNADNNDNGNNIIVNEDEKNNHDANDDDTTSDNDNNDK